MTPEEIGNFIIDVLEDHVEHMFQYALPDLGQVAGYTHALNLVERDAPFIAAKIVAGLQERA